MFKFSCFDKVPNDSLAHNRLLGDALTFHGIDDHRASPLSPARSFLSSGASAPARQAQKTNMEKTKQLTLKSSYFASSSPFVKPKLLSPRKSSGRVKYARRQKLFCSFACSTTKMHMQKSTAPCQRHKCK